MLMLIIVGVGDYQSLTSLFSSGRLNIFFTRIGYLTIRYSQRFGSRGSIRYVCSGLVTSAFKMIISF